MNLTIHYILDRKMIIYLIDGDGSEDTFTQVLKFPPKNTKVVLSNIAYSKFFELKYKLADA